MMLIIYKFLCHVVSLDWLPRAKASIGFTEFDHRNERYICFNHPCFL